MSRRSLEMRMLQRIPKRFLSDPEKVWDGNPGGLDVTYGEKPDMPDPYHITLNIREHYWTMDDIKQHLKKGYPDLDFSTWSISGGYYGRDVTANFPDGRTITVPLETCQALATDHVNPRMFEIVLDKWAMELPYGQRDWLEEALPCYLDENTLKKIAALRSRLAKGSCMNDLDERLQDATGYGTGSGWHAPDIFGFLCDGMHLAKKRRAALYACTTE